MRITFPLCRRVLLFVLFATVILWAPAPITAQENSSAKSRELYDQVKAFSLNGGSVAVKELVLTRDRAQMSFNGSFYFTAAVDGHVTGAVFIGEGKFAAAVPPNEFEKDNLKHLLGAESVE